MRLPNFLAAALVLLFFAAAASLTGATPAPWAEGLSRPEDLVVKLVTIGPADPIYTWWGHSALIVEDARLAESRFYNYGLFSFEQENFVLNFALGRLWFQVGASDSGRELAYYRFVNRSIRIQTLNLSPSKRLEMARFLERNILPENRTYLYHHYNDNCATRVRDLIDRTIDGQLQAATAGPGRMTLRRQTRRFTSHHFIMDWLLMFLMSDVIDRPATEWEEMFLPSELETNVARLHYRDERGIERPLVGKSVTYYQAGHGRDIPVRAPAHWPWGLLIGATAALGALLLGYRLRAGARLAGLLYGLYSAVTGFVFGCLGTVLFLMSMFTDHAVTYGNENLFLANPLTLLAVPFGVAAAMGGERRLRRLGLLWLLLAALAAVYLVLKLLPAFDQDNGLAVATIVPVLFGFAGSACLNLRFGSARPCRFH